MDSSCGTRGVGSRFNNPTNLRPLHREDAPFIGFVDYARYGAYEHFNSVEDGIFAAADLLKRKYLGMLPEDIVRVWAASNGTTYREKVSACYSDIVL